MTQENLLTPLQTASFLGITTTTLKKWRNAKKGPAFTRLGHTGVRYKREDLTEWLEKQTKTTHVKVAALDQECLEVLRHHRDESGAILGKELETLLPTLWEAIKATNGATSQALVDQLPPWFSFVMNAANMPDGSTSWGAVRHGLAIRHAVLMAPIEVSLSTNAERLMRADAGVDKYLTHDGRPRITMAHLAMLSGIDLADFAAEYWSALTPEFVRSLPLRLQHQDKAPENAHQH